MQSPLLNRILLVLFLAKQEKYSVFVRRQESNLFLLPIKKRAVSMLGTGKVRTGRYKDRHSISAVPVVGVVCFYLASCLLVLMVAA